MAEIVERLPFKLARPDSNTGVTDAEDIDYKSVHLGKYLDKAGLLPLEYTLTGNDDIITTEWIKADNKLVGIKMLSTTWSKKNVSGNVLIIQTSIDGSNINRSPLKWAKNDIIPSTMQSLELSNEEEYVRICVRADEGETIQSEMYCGLCYDTEKGEINNEQVETEISAIKKEYTLIPNYCVSGNNVINTRIKELYLPDIDENKYYYVLNCLYTSRNTYLFTICVSDTHSVPLSSTVYATLDESSVPFNGILRLRSSAADGKVFRGYAIIDIHTNDTTNASGDVFINNKFIKGLDYNPTIKSMYLSEDLDDLEGEIVENTTIYENKQDETISSGDAVVSDLSEVLGKYVEVSVSKDIDYTKTEEDVAITGGYVLLDNLSLYVGKEMKVSFISEDTFNCKINIYDSNNNKIFEKQGYTNQNNTQSFIIPSGAATAKYITNVVLHPTVDYRIEIYEPMEHLEIKAYGSNLNDVITLASFEYPDTKSFIVPSWASQLLFTLAQDMTISYTVMSAAKYKWDTDIVKLQSQIEDLEREIEHIHSGITYTVGSQDADFVKIKDCCEFIRANDIKDAKVYVKEGIYDLVSEFTQEYLDSITTGGANILNGCMIGNNTHFIFSEGAKITFIYDGTNKDCVDTFSPFNIYGSFILENADIEVTNGRYCVHEDASEDKRYIVKYINCKMKHNGSPAFPALQKGACIGAGVGQGSLSVIDGGVYYAYVSGSLVKYPISYHGYQVGTGVDYPSRVVLHNVWMNTRFGYGAWGNSTINVEMSGCRLGLQTATPPANFNVLLWANIVET